MNDIRTNLLGKLWHGLDPFSSFTAGLYQEDTQGWKGTHPFLTQSVLAVRPEVVIEVGVWKGQSTLTMARALKKNEIPGVVIAVDTWLGAGNLWVTRQWFEQLCFEGGFPQIVKKFYQNVVSAELTDYIIPLPLDSTNANFVLKASGIKADLIHIDGAHDYRSVKNDIEIWWPLLRSGGILIGDDYSFDGTYPGVRQAFEEFFGALGMLPLEHSGGKCRISKP